jgi:hypothetical protein
MLKKNVEAIIKELNSGNNYNESITLVAATKTIPYEIINQAIELGITDIGENKVNEFKDKYDFIKGAKRHFIGHLQTNKVKYLIGKTFLIHSVDRLELAEEIAKRSSANGIVTDILIQINIGKEDTKSGFYIEEAETMYANIKKLSGIKIKGFMAMLPNINDTEIIENLCLQMRKLYDKIKTTDKDIIYLSLGMSGDYKTAIKCGSNMVRIGSSIFGDRKNI